MAAVPIPSIQPLLEILHSTWQGDDLYVTANSSLAVDNMEAMFFLLVGCEYTMDGEGLHPPGKQVRQVRDAYIAVSGVRACL